MIMLQLFFLKLKGVVEKMNEEKLKEINEYLKQGASLNKLDANGVLGCSRRAFCNQAKKLGYIFDKDIKSFIKSNDITVEITTAEAKSTRKIKEPTIEPRNSAEQTIKSTEEVLTLESLDARLKVLEQQMQHNNSNVVSTLELDSRTASNIISRSIKVSKEAIELFDFIADTRYPMHSKQALLSQALIEFYENHK